MMRNRHSDEAAKGHRLVGLADLLMSATASILFLVFLAAGRMALLPRHSSAFYIGMAAAGLWVLLQVPDRWWRGAVQKEAKGFRTWSVAMRLCANTAVAVMFAFLLVHLG